MFERPGDKTRAALAALLFALVAILARAVPASAQAGVSELTGSPGSESFIEMPCPEAEAPAYLNPATPALIEVARGRAGTSGGLWLSGDRAGGFDQLQWIAGNTRPGLLSMNGEGKVSFNLSVLASAAKVTVGSGDEKVRIVSFLRSDEGLRLLAELTNGPYRFLLHIGPIAPTRAGKIRVRGLLNFDNRYDSRINPLRTGGQKRDQERPPAEFDSMIAIDPDVCWFNLYNRQVMPSAQMTLHELAEAHARLALGLDYLPQVDKPGAHDIAIKREIRFRRQRPGQFVVLPIGENLRLESPNDWLWLFGKLEIERRKGRHNSDARAGETTGKRAENRAGDQDDLLP